MTSPTGLDIAVTGELELLHFIPGRVRIRFRRLKENRTLSEKFRSELAIVQGVQLVEASYLTGTVLIRFDPDLVQWESVMSVAVELGLLPRDSSTKNLDRMWREFVLQPRRTASPEPEI